MTSRPWSLTVGVLGVLTLGFGGETGPARASSGDATVDPNGRGLQLLGAREAILRAQSERAHQFARARALKLYRLLRLAAVERGAGPVPGTATPPPVSEVGGASAPGGERLGGRGVVMAAAVLQRDLEEARLLRAELDRVRLERMALVARAAPPVARPGAGSNLGAPVPTQDHDEGAAAAFAGAVAAPSNPARGFLRPVKGAVLAPFGVGRDAGTGAWIFRAGTSFAARPGEPVRCPGDGEVARVASSVAGGAAVVLTQDQGRWTIVISGLESVAVAPGESVRRGDVLGSSRQTHASSVRVETWRDRTPIDPATVLRAQ